MSLGLVGYMDCSFFQLLFTEIQCLVSKLFCMLGWFVGSSRELGLMTLKALQRSIKVLFPLLGVVDS